MFLIFISNFPYFFNSTFIFCFVITFCSLVNPIIYNITIYIHPYIQQNEINLIQESIFINCNNNLQITVKTPTGIIHLNIFFQNTNIFNPISIKDGDKFRADYKKDAEQQDIEDGVLDYVHTKTQEKMEMIVHAKFDTYKDLQKNILHIVFYSYFLHFVY